MLFPWPKVSRRIYAALLALSAAAAVFLGYSAYGAQMNAYFYDLYFRLRGPQAGNLDRVVIVAVDDATLRARGMLPLNRGLVAQALERICAARPAVVGVDIMFAEPGPPEADAALARALAGCPRAVLSAALAAQGRSVEWMEPLPALTRATAAVGHVHADPDADGVSRQVLLEKSYGGTRHWALAFECFRQMEPAPPGGGLLEADKALEWGALRIPVARRQQRALLVDYAGPEGSFPQVSFEAVLDGSVPPRALAGKAVLLGTTASGVGDRLFMPYSLSGTGMPGVEIHANLLRTLLGGRFLRPLPESAALALVLALAAAVGAALYFLRGAALAIAAASLLVAVHALPYLLFRVRVVAPAFSLAMGFWLPLVVCGAYQYLTVWRRYEAADAGRRRLRDRLDLVAHEMRSPLTTIQGSSELLSRYPLDEERRRQMADLIHSESQRLARMVERFLDVERLAAGELDLRREPVDVRALVEASAARVRPLAQRRKIAVETQLEDAAALGDAELLEFAVYNLLSNAIKYSPETSRVRVAARASGGQALIAVEDQGEGIAPEDAARIFERFYRTRSAQDSGKPGLGLGLAIVREIARHHGGEVRLESRPGQGSKFTLAVPLAAVRTGH